MKTDYNSPPGSKLPGFGHLSKIAHIDPTQPALLVPVEIPKPWGREIWYTGMEERGESEIIVNDEPMPLSTYLANDPGRLANHTPVLLLKVLDPKPQAVLGDLYFEAHEEKQEVYVVTNVDTTAWPSGEGGMRFGMNQEMRASFSDAHTFRAGYLEAVQNYERIRRQIDEAQEYVDAELEETARAHMDSFAHVRKLRTGDVVKVPTWTPHSLLHGVRVVEFQTPTYERYIISFAQQVLTQGHWDSQHAIAHMHIDTPEVEPFETVSPGIERIVRFDEFNVWRVELDKCDALTLDPALPYAVCMGLGGNIRIGELSLDAEQACYIPHAALPKLSIGGSGKLLIAAPNL